MKTEREKALEKIPNGYEVVNKGEFKQGDLVWSGNDFIRDYDFLGESIDVFACVIRPIKTETKETF